jgi:hypothetical protein
MGVPQVARHEQAPRRMRLSTFRVMRITHHTRQAGGAIRRNACDVEPSAMCCFGPRRSAGTTRLAKSLIFATNTRARRVPAGTR